MTEAKLFGFFSSTDILVALTFSAATVGLLFLVFPVVLPRLSSKMALPFHRHNSLEDTKAALEVQDLRFGWMRTLGTALLTAAVAVGGWAFQQQAFRDDPMIGYNERFNLSGTRLRASLATWVIRARPSGSQQRVILEVRLICKTRQQQVPVKIPTRSLMTRSS
jgi:hypothetical protein